MAKILVVDDEPEIRLLTKMMLEEAGYEILEAGSGEECLDMLNLKPDLILLDIMMPGDDGWIVCRKIKEIKDVPIVTFTVRTSADSVKKSYACGAVAQINKPFDRKELISTVKKVLTY